MLKTFRWSTSIYFITCFFLILFLSFLLSFDTYTPSHIIGAIIAFAFLLFILILVLLLNWQAKKYLIKLSSILFDQCDAQQYLVLMSKKATRFVTAKIEISRALFFLGEDAQAVAYCEQARQSFHWINSNVRWSYESIYYNIMFHCALYSNNLALASSYLPDMYRVLADYSPGMAVNYLYALRVANGQYEGAETYLLMRLESSVRMLDRLVISWRIGELYTKLNQPEKARVYYEFVRQNGGTTRYTRMAEAMLQSK